jgi:hypothetical protein
MQPSGSEYLRNWAVQPTRRTPSPGEEATVSLVGVRGSRERFSPATDGMGPTISSIVDRIERGLVHMPVHPERIGVRYPAASLRYRSSRERGITTLAVTLRSAMEGDPRSLFVLLGLSQGADIIRATLQPGVLSPDVLRRCVAIVLLGDPGRDPQRDEPFLRGTREPARGLLARKVPPIPRQLWPRTWSYCLTGDQVGASRRGTLGVLFSGSHTHYERNAERVQDLAAEFVLGRLGATTRDWAFRLT